MKYGDFYNTIFTTWDDGKERFTLRTGKQEKIVIFSIFINFVHVIAQVAAIVTKSTSIIDTAEAIGISTMYLLNLVLRWILHGDYVQAQLLNLMYDSRSK
jgi:hypothetical protein